jgi:preprotein translocase subunit YajC
MTHFGAILQAAASGTGLGSYGTTIAMVVVLVVVFYFFMIRPENKKKKKLKDMRDNLSAGDEITTIGGIIGKVVEISDDSITFETSEDRVRIKVAKWAISTVGSATEQPK